MILIAKSPSFLCKRLHKKIHSAPYKLVICLLLGSLLAEVDGSSQTSPLIGGPISEHINVLEWTKIWSWGPYQEWLWWQRPASNYCSALRIALVQILPEWYHYWRRQPFHCQSGSPGVRCMCNVYTKVGNSCSVFQNYHTLYHKNYSVNLRHLVSVHL